MARLPYALNEAVKLALGSIRTQGDDVIASGPWLKGPHELPHRVVLRRTEREYIVHVQIILVDQHRAFFEHGNYIPVRTQAEAAEGLRKAWGTFEMRVRHYLDIPDETGQSEEDESDDHAPESKADPRLP